MQSNFATAWRAGLTAAMVALVCAAGATAQSQVESLNDQISKSRQRLDQIRENQRLLRSEMHQLGVEVHDVQAELDNLNKQAGNQESLLREMGHQLAIRDQQVLVTTGDLLRTQDELVENQVLFSRRARDLYKRGSLADVQVMLAAESFAQLINRYQYLFLVALHDRLLVKQIEALKNRLEFQSAKLKREVRGLREVRDDKVNELQDLYFLERERGRRLTAVTGMRASTERRLAELERDENELTGLVDRLERERKAAEALAASLPTEGTLSPDARGQLDWPTPGRLIYSFGEQPNDDGTVILRQGIGIAAAEQTPVTAVETGTVVFAQPFLSYGPSVILSHGGGYYSLYLFLSEMLVTPGESVTRGQVIGRVGGADTPEGPHLEFQIRENMRVVDPLPWLRRPRG